MDVLVESSDVSVLDLLRRLGPQRISQLATAMGVTVTAVRQRLNRLTAQDFVDRRLVRNGRGRPYHEYLLTDMGRRQTGSNFADLAIALWKEIRTIKDVEVRRGLLARLSQRLASLYEGQIRGSTTAERMESLAQLFSDRDIPFVVEESDGELPVLKAFGCPYTELADQDRSICAMERMLFSQVLGENLRLSECRLDGPTYCTFEIQTKNRRPADN
jgi:predicted ArsR family transcriptional regulator